MIVTFLGTGTSQGVPMIGCSCDVCTSGDPRDKRLRTAVWIQAGDASMVIDTGPDFRYQALRAQIPRLDAILYTHGHKDHTAGMDDIRAYNYWQKEAIDIFASEETQEVLRREFQYVFSGPRYPGIPEVNVHTIDTEPFTVRGVDILPVKVLHYRMEVLGFRIGDFTYITDANYLPESAWQQIKGSRVLVLNALRHEKHISHFTLAEALEIIDEVKPERAYLTHISHQLGRHEEISRMLPPHVFLATDGLRLEL